MSTECIRRIHTAHDLNVLQIDELQILVVETVVRENLG